MSARPNCPGCGNKLHPDQESCLHCPMSFRDALPEKTILQGDNFRNFGIPIIIFGGLAAVLWIYSQTMWKVVTAGVEDIPADAPAVAMPGGASGFAEASVEADEESGQGTISIMADRGAKTIVVTEWKLRGTVYDLLTLMPVAGARLVLIDNETNLRAVVQTDGQGRYRTILPPLPGRGYAVTISKAGYANSYLNPGTEGVAEMPPERRKELIKDLSSMIAEPASLEPHSGTPLVTDFHLAPK